jgi:hypothetical protein
MKLFELEKGYGFVKIDDSRVVIRKIEKGWEKEGFITSETPRVMVHTEKEGNSEIVKNVVVEFSSWVFPTKFFLKDGDVVSIKCERYKLAREVDCFAGFEVLNPEKHSSEVPLS